MIQTCKSCKWIDRELYLGSDLSKIHCEKNLVKDVELAIGEKPNLACRNYENYYLGRTSENIDRKLIKWNSGLEKRFSTHGKVLQRDNDL